MTNKKILVLITSYNRHDMLVNLLRQLKEKSKGFDLNIQLFVDDEIFEGNYCDIPELISSLKFDSWAAHHQKHKGKSGYWETMNNAFTVCSHFEFDYLIQIPDDIQIVDDFFKKAVEIFEAIPDKYKSCLNLLNDVSRKGAFWTPIDPRLVKLPVANVYRTGWVDMCYIANKYFFKILGWKINPVSKNWAVDPERSSGVGKQISERIYQNGTYIYQVENSLVIHGVHESVMHPVARKKVPLITNYNERDVSVGIASIPERIESLRDTILSLLPQVGKIYVYLNRYDRVPDFCRHAKIKAVLSKNELGDLGDVGKYYFIDQANGYYFSVDDDLVYPVDYVARYITAIEQHNREVAITSHGRCFDLLPVKSYYHGHSKSFRCLGDQPEDEFVHVGGTGVMAFHTEKIKISLNDFKLINMADIWFAKSMSEQGRKIVSIAHKAGWIRESNKYDRDYTIYNFCHKNDQQQTEIINQINF